MKKFIINLFFIFSITLLILSLILLTFIFLWENRSVIGKNFGIAIKDNCEVSDLQLQCDFIDISSQNFSAKLKNIQMKIDPFEFLKRNEPFIFVKIEEGQIYLKVKKEEKIKEKNPINYGFFFIYFVKSDVDKINLYVDLPKNKFILEDFSFHSNYDSFYTKRPFNFKIKGEEGTVTEFYGSIHMDSIFLKKLKAVFNGNTLVGEGKFEYSGDFSFNGSLTGEHFKVGNVSFRGFKVLFNANQKKGFLKTQVHLFSNKMDINNFFIEEVKALLKVGGKEKYRGNIKINAQKLKTNDLQGKNAFYEGKVQFSSKENIFKTEGVLTISSIFYKEFSLPVNSDIKVIYALDKKDLKTEGRVSIGKVVSDFRYTKKVLTVETKEFFLSDVYLLGKSEIVNGRIQGKTVIDFKNRVLEASVYGKDLNIYGILFEEGEISSKFSIEKKTGNFSVILRNENSFCFVKGNLKDDKVDAEIDFENINTESFIYGEKFNFGGIISGRGNMYGSVADLHIDLQGKAKYFHYQNLYLKWVDFKFSFINKTKNLQLFFKTGNTDGLLDLVFKPFSLNLVLNMKNSDISFTKNFLKDRLPMVFNTLTPQRITGNVQINLKKDEWEFKTNISKGRLLLDKLGESVFIKMKGNFSNYTRFLEAEIYKNDFNLQGYKVKELLGNLFLKDNKLSGTVVGKGLQSFEEMDFRGKFMADIRDKNLDGEIDFSLKKEEMSTHLKSQFRGNFEKIRGTLEGNGFKKNMISVETKLFYEISIFPDYLNLKLNTDLVKMFLPNKIKCDFEKIKGTVTVPFKDFEKAKGEVSVENFTVSKNYLYFFESSPVKLFLEKGVIKGKPVSFMGIIKGKVEEFSYDLLSNQITLYSEGILDRNLLSLLTRYINTYGDLKYILSFNGSLNNFKDGLYLSVFSEDMEIKTLYTVGIIKLQKVLFELSKGRFSLDIDGKTSDSILGESVLQIEGEGSLKETQGKLLGYTQLFPIKFKNLFQGNINSNLQLEVSTNTSTFQGELKGEVLISGKLKLEKDLKNFFQKEVENRPTPTLENLESLGLDISFRSFIPIYLYGKWGKAYGEVDLRIQGTGKNPQINGNINIIYGEIYFMKNRYSIDFANIKIVNNEPYISARVSTSVADTFIFIDISGSVHKPKINFFSNPPKSKNEILSILLLKDTPSALENMPVFKTVGRLLYAVLPFKPSEEVGLFNTGFEVNILPQYSPSTGISASIYGKKNLTRRIFVALSKPLGQVEEEKIGGWYGVGIRLKERTSFQYKFFETGNQEFGIVFSLPFDF